VSTYDDVIGITKRFMGPAAERFIERQCKLMKTEPAKLAATDLPQLAWLTKNAAGVYMDVSRADEMADQIAGLK
jgi:hypothetical protein